MTEFLPSDAKGQWLHQSYDDFVAAVRQNLNPESNTVLLVDDERGIRAKVARDVKNFDSRIAIHQAANGKEALEKLAQIRDNYMRDPLMIVLDLNMPVMDGWTFIDKLREDYESKGLSAGIPIVVLSSTSGEKNAGLFRKKSIHGGKAGYTPLIAIAKEACADSSRYDSSGDEGLLAWLEHFIKK